MKKYLLISFFLLLPLVIFAATTDFTANGNITVSGVTFGSGTTNMLILSGSTAESWKFNGGTFTVTNPGSAFQVGSSDSAVKSIQVSQSGTTLVCAENSTPGTSYATAPTTAGTYTIAPSETTNCTSLCTQLSGVASYNSFSTCGAATCNSGYWLSGSGSGATCVLIGGGGVIGGGGGGTIPTPVYTVIPGIGAVTTTTPVTPVAASVATPSAVAQVVSPVFNTTLKYGVTSNDVKRLQQLLATDKSIYPEGIVSGWFGQLTRKAIQRFQCKHNIICSGTPTTTGYGSFGPKTKAKVADIFKTSQ